MASLGPELWERGKPGDNIMAKKEVSAIVSGMGLGMSILTALMEKAKKRGLSDEAIHRLATPEGDALLDKFVSILAEASGALANLFPIQVNYDLHLEAAIKSGNYGWTNSDITNKNFLTKRTGQHKVEIKLFHFNKTMTSEEVIQEMDKQGYRPVELPELLAFGAKYPDEQKKYPIVGLGSVWRYWGGYRDVPCLGRRVGGRDLLLDCFGGMWGESCRFAAVRK